MPQNESPSTPNLNCTHELHVHLQGAIPPAFLEVQLKTYPLVQLVSSAPERLRGLYLNHPSIALVTAAPTPAAAVTQLLKIESFPEFLRAYIFSLLLIRREEELVALIAAVSEQFHQQGIRSVELTVAPYEYTLYGLTYREILRALRHGQAAAKAEFGLDILWIFDPIRTFGPDRAEALFDTVMAEHSSTFGAITIGGDEQAAATKNFKRLYRMASAAGLGLTAHAGELCGAVSVWQAIDELGVTRVGHGVRAVEDAVLLKTLATRNIPLELCISSNLATGVVRALSSHPARALYDAGVALTVNTDDPTFFKTTLAREVTLLQGCRFTAAEIQKVIANNEAYRFGRGLKPAL